MHKPLELSCDGSNFFSRSIRDKTLFDELFLPHHQDQDGQYAIRDTAGGHLTDAVMRHPHPAPVATYAGTVIIRHGQ